MRVVPLQYVGPDICSIDDETYSLIDPETGNKREWVCHGHPCILRTDKPVHERFIVRVQRFISENVINNAFYNKM